MKRLPSVAIQQPGAAESKSSQSLQSVYSHRRAGRGSRTGGIRRHEYTRLTPTDTPFSLHLPAVQRHEGKTDEGEELRFRSRGVI